MRKLAASSLEWTKLPHNDIVVFMIPEFEPDGNLQPGIHWTTWDEMLTRFGATPWRRDLLHGLRAAIDSLQAAGCRTVYVDGSLVTGKLRPGDFDGCWEETGIDFTALDPVLLTFDQDRATQKAKYGGELFPASSSADLKDHAFLEFFQTDKETGRKKGIIALDLGGLT